ncbi:hypothetical protein AB205_0046350 [Aquarana catesbeiana]|uniref:Uncharacterized protein n=1 Tax=Aquarana catesbeiana TaxID=8400 RepID=A0A2G9S2Y7_AQUCT|nr:hypothetical protein AB205_0046350 [Aquarana catesbeiana]
MYYWQNECRYVALFEGPGANQGGCHCFTVKNQRFLCTCLPNSNFLLLGLKFIVPFVGSCLPF